jgi:hypothetical protein
VSGGFATDARIAEDVVEPVEQQRLGRLDPPAGLVAIEPCDPVDLLEGPGDAGAGRPIG